ncbi:MAG: tetratricopeptide repeat protein [Candidatus Peregrinibacteria bacterium]
MEHSRARRRWWDITVIVVLIALPFFAFGRSLLQGYAPIDDLFVVVRNLATRGPTWDHIRTAFTTFDPELYIPATLVSFQLNYLISGFYPWSYHLVNVLLHGMNAVLLFLILKKVTQAPRASLFTAALFAVHPINAEAVVWITARKDLLSTFFAFASTLAFLRQTRRGLLLGFVLFLFALLAKVSAAPLPLVFPLLLTVQGKKWDRKTLLVVLPFLLLSVAFVGLALFGKERIVQTSHGWETLLLAPWSFLFLIGKFVYPQHLSPLYEVSDPIAFTNPWIVASLAGFLCFFCFLCFSFLRKKSLRPAPYALALIITLLLFSPAFLTFRKAGTVFLASDRYLYLPGLGLLLLIALLLKGIGERWTLPKPVIAGPGGFLIALLCLLSIKQTQLWNSADTLFTHALLLTPRSVAARTALAQTRLDMDQPQEAFAILKEGLKLGDDPRLHLAAGNVYAHVGQVPEALGQFNKAKQMDPKNADAWFSIGSVEEQTGNSDAALENYRIAVQLDPSDVPALVGIGRLLSRKGDLAGAEQAYRSALSWNPNFMDAHRGLAPVLAKTGRTDEAQVHLELGLELSKP